MSARTQKSICLSREYAEKDVGVVGMGAGCAGCVGAGAGAGAVGADTVGGMNADAVGADTAGVDTGVCADAEGADAGCMIVSSELLGKHAFTINFGRTRPCLTSQIGVKIIST